MVSSRVNCGTPKVWPRVFIQELDSESEIWSVDRLKLVIEATTIGDVSPRVLTRYHYER